MDIGTYFDSIMNGGGLVCFDRYDTITAEKHIVSYDKTSFTCSIVVCTLKSSAKVYFFSCFWTDDTRTRMFCFIVFPKCAFFYFAPDNTACVESWFPYDSSPEDFYIFFERTFFYPSIALDGNIICESRIRDITKRSDMYIFSDNAIDHVRAWMYGIAWHEGILVKKFFYPLGYPFPIMA